MVQCSFFFLNWVQSKKRNKHFPCLLRFQICLSILMKQTLNLKKKESPSLPTGSENPKMEAPCQACLFSVLSYKDHH